MKKIILKGAISMSIVFFRGIFIACLCTGVLAANNTTAQHKSISEVYISIKLDQATVKTALESIEGQTKFKFAYEGHVVGKQSHRLTLNVENGSVAEVLQTIADETGLSFRQVNEMIVVKLQPRRKKTIKKEARLEQTISGKVTDDSGEPLPGANVLVKGTGLGVITDADGNYRLSAPDYATTLIFSFIGYLRQEVEINGRSVIDVTLLPDVTTLDEIVVSTGYWETEEKLNPGNIAKVSSDEIEKQPITTPLQALSGRMAGVNVIQRTGIPGGGIDIQIRGRNSLNRTANNPLYVVDGVPYPSAPLVSGFVGQVFNSDVGPINNINPSDIQSIEVLKDADATAIYGSRGANGVVLITTKRGKPGKTTIDINHYSGIGKVSKKMDLLNSQQYREMVIEGLANDGFDPIPEFFEPFLPSLFAWDSTRFTDWQEELIGGTANYSNTQFSVSGGNANTQFLFSGSYFRQTTVFPGDFALQRGSGHLNLNHKSSDQRFTASVSLSYVAEQNELPREDITSDAVQAPPNAPEPFNEEGNLNFEEYGISFNNPFSELLKIYEGKTRNLVTNMTMGYQIIPDLKLKVNLGYNNITVDETNINPIRSQNPEFEPTGFTAFGNSSSETWLFEPQAEYKKEIGSGQLNILIGATFQETTDERQEIAALGYTSDALLGNIDASPDVNVQDVDFSEYRYNALFGRLNYNWKNKYIINLTGRRDGSSRFGPGNQFGNFGAVGAAWIFSNEPAIQNSLSFLSFGKVRVSYGITGSDQIGNYEFLETHEATDFSLLGTVGLVPTRLPNPEFGWENNKKVEGAIELGLVDDRVLFTTSYYRNRSSNQLVGIPLAGTTGFNTIRSNFPATVENRGWEFEVNASIIHTNNFQWNTSFNLTIPRNEIIEFPNIEGSSFANTFTVGESIFTTKGFKFTGIDPETGLYSFEDLNEDGETTTPEDLQPVLDFSQDFFGGISNSLSYKGFALSFLFQFVKQTGTNTLRSFGKPGTRSNHPTIILERWQKPGDITDIQKYSVFGSDTEVAFQNSFVRGTNALDDASFIRLQNIALSYTFPGTISETLKLQNLRIYIQGQNLFTITDYIGLDPETQSSTRLPPLSVLTAGINLQL